MLTQEGSQQLARTALALQNGYTSHPEFSNKNKIVPNREEVISILMEIRGVLLPGYFPSSVDEKNPVTLLEVLGAIQWRLARLIHDSIEHACPQTCKMNPNCICEIFRLSLDKSTQLVERLPDIREILLKDIQAAYDGDPAASNLDEIILAYPSLFAVMVYRIANILHKLDVGLIPRIMTEYAHSRTGIDIHPSASIGHSFFIDHGTGVVIGATCEIGNHVKIYQGVTLGALSFEKDEAGALVRGTKRHPTIEDHVTIYAGATVLGGSTVIGAGSVIGGNVWLTESVPQRSKVISRPQIELRK
ncbi:serine acetyltransferase [Fodinisporobacter ferrooxydans]|uniref:Serine acetyltransferase n=1 Tax=Fodinisporobacter ferrooxydans TaxID=2901836 RepID=A0ABY4CG12_9BACL|nr:serine acetyltransferase [Alicyclobacillaceae bacterium MYW30-H2]